MSTSDIPMSSIPQTDIVFVPSLELSADIGPDRWGKARPQPIRVSVYLHLHASYLARIGDSDDVTHSVHYGILSKLVAKAVDNTSFSGIGELIDVVNKAAFELAGEALAAVRVIVDSRQMILLAEGISFEVMTPPVSLCKDLPTKVTVKDLILAIIIGVNAPEREEKQRVVINIIFYEMPRSNAHAPVNYHKLTSQIAKEVEASSYLTLEKLVTHILRTACLASESIEAATVRVQKPSAVLFAHSSGVEITRQRSSFT